MARTYKRDANGRFAGGGGSTRSGRPAAKPVSRGKNRITRDNAGRIASVGGEGATARGGRLRTAAGNKRAVQAARIKGAGGKLRKPMGSGRGAAKAAAQKKLSGTGKAPPTRLPKANSDEYKYNKAGLIASPQERARMRGRDRAREKNAALAQQQAAGQRKAERKAARKLTSDQTDPLSVTRYSSTYRAAENAVTRRSKRAADNFSAGIGLERQKASLTQKAVKMQQKAAERKAQGKKITSTMEANFQQLRKQIGKIDRSLATRRKAMSTVAVQSRRMEINTKDRPRY